MDQSALTKILKRTKGTKIIFCLALVKTRLRKELYQSESLCHHASSILSMCKVTSKLKHIQFDLY